MDRSKIFQARRSSVLAAMASDYSSEIKYGHCLRQLDCLRAEDLQGSLQNVHIITVYGDRCLYGTAKTPFNPL